MNNAGKIKFRKDKERPKLMDSILFILIVILCLVTMVTVQIKSQQKREAETSNMQRVEATEPTEAVSVPDVSDSVSENSNVYVESDSSAGLEEAQMLQESALLKNSINTDSIMEDTTEDSTETAEPDIRGKSLSFSSPLKGNVIKPFSSSQLLYSQTLDDWRMHLGIDIGAPIGTEVYACESGMVEEIYDDEEFGATVTVRHNEQLVTRYSNLALSHTVEVGDMVDKGQKIGVVGDTAMYEILDEPHLHFSFSDNGGLIDPDVYIDFEYDE